MATKKIKLDSGSSVMEEARELLRVLNPCFAKDILRDFARMKRKGIIPSCWQSLWENLSEDVRSRILDSVTDAADDDLPSMSEGIRNIIDSQREALATSLSMLTGLSIDPDRIKFTIPDDDSGKLVALDDYCLDCAPAGKIPLDEIVEYIARDAEGFDPDGIRFVNHMRKHHDSVHGPQLDEIEDE